MTIICRECGMEDGRQFAQPYMEKMEEHQLCFSDLHWYELYLDRDNANSVRINGRHYYIGDPNAIGLRGFGGRKYVIKFHDGRIVETTNLWTQGEIPDRWRERLPDNAEFVES